MKVLVICSRFFMGGFTKSLINFLLCADKYEELDITVLSLQKNETEDYKEIPSRFRYISMDPLEYASVKKGLNKEYLFNKQRFVNVEYVLESIINKVRHKPFSHKSVMKYVAYADASRAKRVCTDFSFCDQYDVAISWEELFCNYLLVEKIPVKYKVGYIHPNYAEAEFCKAADRQYLNRLDRIVTVSESCKKTLCSVFPQYNSKIEYIENRLSTERIRSKLDEYSPHIDHSYTNLLTVCRIDNNHKAVFRIVNLAGRLLNAGCIIKWYVIGDGPDFNELQLRIKTAGLEQSIICLGQMDNPYPYMKAADLFVLQSNYEGRPVAVDEAMAIGTPTLITNYSSACEQIQDGVNGWIADIDEDAIFDRLYAIITHPHMLEEVKRYLLGVDNEYYENCQPMIDLLKGMLGD